MNGCKQTVQILDEESRSWKSSSYCIQTVDWKRTAKEALVQRPELDTVHLKRAILPVCQHYYKHDYRKTKVELAPQ